jgi:hypothetical protein
VSRTPARVAVVVALCAVAWLGLVPPAPSVTQAGSGLVSGELSAVDPVSATNVWAVGSYWLNPSDEGNFLGLTAHRVAGVWKKVSSPQPSSVVAELNGVEAISATNVWAVGEYNSTSSGTDKTLILHWTGGSWKVVPSPSPGTFGNGLADVSGVAGNDVWAVGYFGKPNTLILHWTGNGWKTVPSPNPGAFGDVLNAVDARTGSDVWAVGYYVSNADVGPKTLIAHYDGTSWSHVPGVDPSEVDNELYGVYAAAERDAWAVGYYTEGTGDKTLALRWDGVTWTQVDTPNPNGEGAFMAVDGVAPDDVWAVGATGSATVKTLIAHWDGVSWTTVPSPNKVTGTNVLQSVKARAANDVWAVGYYRGTTGSSKTLILHWNGSSWSVV